MMTKQIDDFSRHLLLVFFRWYINQTTTNMPPEVKEMQEKFYTEYIERFIKEGLHEKG